MTEQDANTLPRRTAAFIRKHDLIAPGQSVIAAVSGGPDSTALLDLLIALGDELRLGPISVAHFDHGTRGGESREDLEFVRQMAAERNLAFFCESADVSAFAARRKISFEMAARACRHGFFRDLLENFAEAKLALAHTADDQAEEVLLRLFRGAGPSGLCAMKPQTRAGIVRPLLFAARSEILSYLDARGLSYRTDSSNLEPISRRNALRNEIMPLVRRHFHGQIARTLGRHALLAADEDSFWRDVVEQTWASVATAETGDRICLDLAAIRACHPALARRVLRSAIERLRGDIYGVEAVHVEALRMLAASGRSGARAAVPGGLFAQIAGPDLCIGLSGRPRELWNPAVSDEMGGPGVYRHTRRWCGRWCQ